MGREHVIMITIVLKGRLKPIRMEKPHKVLARRGKSCL
jgi:hypothetical protein